MFGQQQPEVNLTSMRMELDMVTQLYNNIMDGCHTKCIDSTYHTGDLTKGESVCLDRCVAKYFQVNTKVGSKLTGNVPAQ